MKRIIFYAVAVGIFVSSVLAKPARGAGWTDECLNWDWTCGNIGNVCGADAAPGLSGSEQGVEWFPGQGPEMSQTPEVQESQAQSQGTEWFPGQGPEMNPAPDTQSPDIQIPETQAPWTDWFFGQNPWTDWFPERPERKFLAAG